MADACSTGNKKHCRGADFRHMHSIMTGATIHMQEAEALFCAYRFALRGQGLIQSNRAVCCQHFNLHADAVADSDVFGLLADALQHARNAGFINTT